MPAFKNLELIYGHQEVGLFTFKVSVEYLQSIYCLWIIADAFQTTHSCPIFSQSSRLNSKSCDILPCPHSSDSAYPTLNWCPSP